MSALTKAGARMADAVAPTNLDPVLVTATIPNAGSVSAGVALNSGRVVGMVMPGAWTAAVVTFRVSVDGQTYQDLVDQFGADVTVTATQAKTHQLDPAIFLGYQYVQVRSGPSSGPVAQAASRDIILVTVG